MATRQVESWNEVPAANDFAIEDGGAPPAHQRTMVDNATRERMAAMATLYQDGLEWLDLLRDPTDRSVLFPVARASSTTIDITSGLNDLSSLFNAGRRIQTTTSGAATDYLEVESVAYANPTTAVTIYTGDGGSVTAGIDGLLLHMASTLGRLAFQVALTNDYIVPTALTEAAFDAALATASSQGGGTILLLEGVVTLTDMKSIPAKTRIIGQGRWSSGFLMTDDTKTALFQCPAAGSNSFESFYMTCPNTGSTHGIDFSVVPGNITIRDLHIQDAGGSCLNFGATASLNDTHISECSFANSKGDTIHCENVNSDAVSRNTISNVSIRRPGGNATSGTVYGIHLGGQWALSGITIWELDAASPVTQVGIGLIERLAIAPNEQDAYQCSIVGVNISGSGQLARGIDMNGRKCSVVGGSIYLPGAGTTGVKVAGTLGMQMATDNKLQAVSITAAVGYDEPATPAERNTVMGCTFSDCGVGIRVGATDSLVYGNTIKDSTSKGIQVVSGAVRPRIASNEIIESLGTSIELVSGDRVSVHNNEIYGGAFNGIHALAAVTNCRVSGNDVEAIGGTAYLNQATTNAKFQNNLPAGHDVHVHKSSNWSASPYTETAVPELSGVAFPAGDGGPDGAHKYRVQGYLLYSQTNVGVYSNVVIRIRMGAAGPAGVLQTADNAVAPTAKGVAFDFIVQPVAGDTISVTADMNGGDGNDTLNVIGSAGWGTPATDQGQSHIEISRFWE